MPARERQSENSMLRCLFAALFFPALFTAQQAQDHPYYDNYSGVATVVRGNVRFTAAFVLNDFDPDQAPGLGLQQLFRVRLIPSDNTVINSIAPENLATTIGQAATPQGHQVMTFGQWRIEMTMENSDLRDHLRQIGQTDATTHSSPDFEIIVTTSRDEIAVVAVKRGSSRQTTKTDRLPHGDALY